MASMKYHFENKKAQKEKKAKAEITSCFFLEQSQLFLIILFKLLRLLAYFNFNYEKSIPI